MQELQQSEATAAQRRIFFHAVDATDGIAAESALTGTGWFSKNGATPAASTASISEINATNMPGRYYIEATATELDTLGIIEFRYKAAACAEVIARAQVKPYDPYDAVRLGLTALPNAAAEAAGGLYTRGTGAGQINQGANGMVDVNIEQWLDSVVNALIAGRVDGSVGAMAADVVTAAAVANGALDAATFAAGAFDAVWSVATRILTASTNFNDPSAATIADAVWDEDIEAAHGGDAAAGLLLRALGAAISNRANNATLDALLGVADAAGEDVPSQVTDEVLDEAVAGHVGAGTIGNLVERLDLIATGGAGELTGTRSGNLDNLNATVASRAIAGDAMALTAAAVDGIWDEDIVAAHGTADTAGLLLRALGALISQRSNNPTLHALLGISDVAAQDLAEQLLRTEAMAELGVAIPAAEPTVEELLMLGYHALRDKLTSTTTLTKLHNDAGTPIVDQSTTYDGTTSTRNEMVAGT